MVLEKIENNEQRIEQDPGLKERGYHLIKRLGEGSYAVVYLSEYVDMSSERQKVSQLACKVIDTSKAPPNFTKKFLPRELEILARVNHPHIIHIHSIFQRREKYYIFMRFAENGDLLEYILKNGPIKEWQARIWLRQLALAVQYLHNEGIVHRDLKCENALITANFNIKLSDFGFARYVVKGDGRKSLSNTYCGSISYAAPEVLKGLPYHPKVSDIWSLGVILFVMLTKCTPFDDHNAKMLYLQQMRRHWKFKGNIEEKLSFQVKLLLRELLEPDVSKRATISQVLSSEFIRMDIRLTEMTTAEKDALAASQYDLRRPWRRTFQLKSNDLKILKMKNPQADMSTINIPESNGSSTSK